MRKKENDFYFQIFCVESVQKNSLIQKMEIYTVLH